MLSRWLAGWLAALLAVSNSHSFNSMNGTDDTTTQPNSSTSKSYQIAFETRPAIAMRHLLL